MARLEPGGPESECVTRNKTVTAWREIGYSETCMARDIQLDGAEISVIKCLGVGSGEKEGSELAEACADLDISELMDTVKGLMSVGYVDADSDSFHNEIEFGKVHFRVNSGYTKDLRDALDQRPEPKQSKRVRRE